MNHSLNGSILPMSTLLPPEVRASLVAASRVESRIDAGECSTRTSAIDAVVDAARSTHPQYFNEEK